MSATAQDKIFNEIDRSKVPKHVAVIMDGNGRWARKIGKERFFGHNSGINSVRDTIEASIDIGVETLTLYVFSLENWKRPEAEVKALMHLLLVQVSVARQSLSSRQPSRHANVSRSQYSPNAQSAELVQSTMRQVPSTHTSPSSQGNP